MSSFMFTKLDLETGLILQTWQGHHPIEDTITIRGGVYAYLHQQQGLRLVEQHTQIIHRLPSIAQAVVWVCCSLNASQILCLSI